MQPPEGAERLKRQQAAGCDGVVYVAEEGLQLPAERHGDLSNGSGGAHLESMVAGFSILRLTLRGLGITVNNRKIQTRKFS
jgi:hypothetical protein